MILDPLISTIFQNQRNQNFHTVQSSNYDFISHYYYFLNDKLINFIPN